MPVIPSEVGGVEPGGLSIDGGPGRRLRELIEVLLTARAKMLGFSQQMAHELSQVPPRLRSSIVNGLGEIVTHLDSFEIKPGETRLTGKVKLGADIGMAQHFPGEGARGSGLGARGGPEFEDLGRRGHRPFAPHRELGHVPLGPKMRLATSYEPPTAMATAVAMTSPWPVEEPRRELAERASEPSPRRRRRRKEEEEADRSTGRKDDRVGGTASPYEELWAVARRRHRKGLSRHALDRIEHAMLAWVCLALLQEAPPARPEASFEQREEALESLSRMGYARRAGKGWRPTPAGFEASGLVGFDGQLELDP